MIASKFVQSLSREKKRLDFGADILKGSSGNDRIFHFATDNSLNTRPDGSPDTIDCGGGNNDEAWINVLTDHDTAVNCETVHSDVNP